MEITKEDYEFVRNVVRSLNGGKEVEDITQEVFLKVLSAKKELTRKELRRYLFTTALNTIRDKWRKKKRQPILTEIFNTLKSPFCLEDHLLKKEEIENLKKAMKQLKKEERKILTMREIKNMSYREISKRTGIKEASLRSIVMRAKQKILKIVEEEGYKNVQV